MASLGKKLSVYISQYFTNPAEKIISKWHMAGFIEGRAPHYKYCETILDEKLLQDVAKIAVNLPMEKDGYALDYPCLIHRNLLERIDMWKPWISFNHWLSTEDLAPFIVFRNDTATVTTKGLLHCAEIRFYPIVDLENPLYNGK